MDCFAALAMTDARREHSTRSPYLPRIAQRKRPHTPDVLARDQAADDRRLGALYRKSGGPEAEHAVGFLGGKTPLDQHVIDMGDQFAGGKAHLMHIEHVLVEHD